MRLLPGVLWLALVAPVASAYPAERPGGDRWPPSVAQFIERSGNCQHFAGEFGGDGSPRDAEVNREMDTLRCNALLADLQTLRKRYHADARISARLAAFDDEGMPTDAGAED